MDFGRLYFSLRGRINRKGWWLANIGLLLIGLLVSFFVGIIIGAAGYMDSAIGVHATTILVVILILYPSYALSVKRLHDRGRPEWLALLFLAPSVINALLEVLSITGSIQTISLWGQEILTFVPNIYGTVLGFLYIPFIIWIVIELGILPGQQGPNDHGSDPSA